MNAPNRALAHYTAMARQAETVNFRRIAANLSFATNVPTLGDVQTLIFSLRRLSKMVGCNEAHAIQGMEAVTQALNAAAEACEEAGYVDADGEPLRRHSEDDEGGF